MTRITYTGVLDVTRATAEALAKLLLEHRERLGTRKGTRALRPFNQSVLILRWFLDGARLTQLARDNRISVPTAYRYLHEGSAYRTAAWGAGRTGRDRPPAPCGGGRFAPADR